MANFLGEVSSVASPYVFFLPLIQSIWVSKLDLKLDSEYYKKHQTSTKHMLNNSMASPILQISVFLSVKSANLLQNISKKWKMTSPTVSTKWGLPISRVWLGFFSPHFTGSFTAFGDPPRFSKKVPSLTHENHGWGSQGPRVPGRARLRVWSSPSAATDALALEVGGTWRTCEEPWERSRNVFPWEMYGHVLKYTEIYGNMMILKWKKMMVPWKMMNLWKMMILMGKNLRIHWNWE